jgi:hypothetical protein
MKRTLSLLVLFLFATFALKLSAAEAGKAAESADIWTPVGKQKATKKNNRRKKAKKQTQDSQTPEVSKAQFESEDEEPAPIKREITISEKAMTVAAIKAALTIEPTEDTGKSDIEFDLTTSATKDAEQSGRVTTLARTFSAVVTENIQKDVILNELAGLFDETKEETAENMKKNQIAKADELATKRDLLSKLVTDKRTERDAKKAEISTTKYNMYYTDLAAKASLVKLQAAQKLSGIALQRANKERNLQEVDVDTTYHVEHYDSLFKTAQQTLTEALEDSKKADKEHRTLVYELETKKAELTDILNQKKTTKLERNKTAHEHSLITASNSIPSTLSYVAQAFGYTSDDEIALSGDEEFGPFQGCLNKSETLALTETSV